MQEKSRKKSRKSPGQVHAWGSTEFRAWGFRKRTALILEAETVCPRKPTRLPCGLPGADRLGFQNQCGAVSEINVVRFLKSKLRMHWNPES